MWAWQRVRRATSTAGARLGTAEAWARSIGGLPGHGPSGAPRGRGVARRPCARRCHADGAPDAAPGPTVPAHPAGTQPLSAQPF